jgi:hypothetical protein
LLGFTAPEQTLSLLIYTFIFLFYPIFFFHFLFLYSFLCTEYIVVSSVLSLHLPPSPSSSVWFGGPPIVIPHPAPANRPSYASFFSYTLNLSKAACPARFLYRSPILSTWVVTLSLALVQTPGCAVTTTPWYWPHGLVNRIM